MTVFVSKELLKLLEGRASVRQMALNDGSGNVTMIPFILGDSTKLATAFIGAVTEKQVFGAVLHQYAILSLILR
jgi:hypothetical protein